MNVGINMKAYVPEGRCAMCVPTNNSLSKNYFSPPSWCKLSPAARSPPPPPPPLNANAQTTAAPVTTTSHPPNRQPQLHPTWRNPSMIQPSAHRGHHNHRQHRTWWWPSTNSNAPNAPPPTRATPIETSREPPSTVEPVRITPRDIILAIRKGASILAPMSVEFRFGAETIRRRLLRGGPLDRGEEDFLWLPFRDRILFYRELSFLA